LWTRWREVLQNADVRGFFEIYGLSAWTREMWRGVKTMQTRGGRSIFRDFLWTAIKGFGITSTKTETDSPSAKEKNASSLIFKVMIFVVR